MKRKMVKTYFETLKVYDIALNVEYPFELKDTYYINMEKEE